MRQLYYAFCNNPFRFLKLFPDIINFDKVLLYAVQLLKATEEEYSSQINSLEFPAVPSPTKAHYKLSVKKSRIEPKFISVKQPDICEAEHTSSHVYRPGKSRTSRSYRASRSRECTEATSTLRALHFSTVHSWCLRDKIRRCGPGLIFSPKLGWHTRRRRWKSSWTQLLLLYVVILVGILSILIKIIVIHIDYPFLLNNSYIIL